MGALTTIVADSVITLSEDEIIRRVVQGLAEAAPPFPAGPGGDCAHLPNQSSQGFRVSTIDAVILGQHFDVACEGYQAGVKLVNRNLSDLAAAGATPSDGLLSIAMGGDIAIDWLESFAHGVGRAAQKVRLNIVGGDVARGPKGSFIATLALQGFAHRILTRRTAQNQDMLFVTGKLGGSRYGYHLHFQPRLSEGIWLSAQSEVTSCTDLSDGLAKDLPNLLGSKLDFHLNPAVLPISEAAVALSKADGVPPLEHALFDGEDYELLWTVRADRADFIAEQFRRLFPLTPLTCLGPIQHGTGKLISQADGQKIPMQAFSHFA